MKIVNDKIYISQGETPTYDVNVYDKKTGIPFMLPSEMQNPIIEFIVRPSVYNRDDDFVLRKYLDFSSYKRFDYVPTVIEEIPEVSINDIENDVSPSTENMNKLHIYSHNGIKDYYYYENSSWVKYVFNITFKMNYASTSKMEAKTYKYEVVLFDATPKYQDSELIGLEDIAHKKFLLEATDFIVGGSLSE